MEETKNYILKSDAFLDCDANGDACYKQYALDRDGDEVILIYNIVCESENADEQCDWKHPSDIILSADAKDEEEAREQRDFDDAVEDFRSVLLAFAKGKYSDAMTETVFLSYVETGTTAEIRRCIKEAWYKESLQKKQEVEEYRLSLAQEYATADWEELAKEINGWAGQTVQVTHSAKRGYQISHSADLIIAPARFIGNLEAGQGAWTAEELEQEVEFLESKI